MPHNREKESLISVVFTNEEKVELDAIRKAEGGCSRGSIIRRFVEIGKQKYLCEDKPSQLVSTV